MAQFTPKYSLYKWGTSDEKLVSFMESAKNSDKLETELSKLDERVTTAQTKANAAGNDATSARITAESADTTASEAKALAQSAEATANTADQTASEAITLANDAKSTSDTVKSQFDQVVAEAGSNNPEVVQARGSEVNLNARLNKVDTLLADIVINANNFGAKGDGLTNDASAIQSVLNSLKGKRGKVLLPSESYVINESLTIPDNVELIGKNTKIINNNTTSSDGLFNAVGKVETTKYNLSADALKGATTLSFSTLPPVVTGDALSLSQTGSYYLAVVKVESVNEAAKTITIETPLMHDYFISQTAAIQRVTLAKNVHIEGFEFEFKTTQDLSPIKLWCAENVSVRDIKASGFGGNAVELDSCLNFTVENVKAKNPSNVDSGRGYAVMVHQGSSFGVISNVFGYKTRHTVDIAGGSHSISVKDCLGVKNITQTFGLHGQHEKNITFEGCKDISSVDGGFTIGNASYGRTEEISLINCTSYFSNIGFNTVLSDNITLIGCKAHHSKLLNYQVDSSTNVSVKNSESIGRTSHIQRSTNIVFDVACSKVPTSEDPLWIFNDAKEVTVTGSIRNDARYGIQVGSTTGGHLPVSKITIGSDIKSNGEFCIIVRANVSELTVNNAKLNAVTGASIYLTAGASKVIVKDNEIVGSVNNNVNKNIVIKDNVGSFSILNTSTTDTANGRLIEANHNWVA